ncbi:MAG TPA: hypothetical protein PLJ21_04065 [Pseudobdellovibrionaceae bacterium]|nr:hypothetical protein [Pseudobdellovibrionaceae bacterium]
MIRQHIRFSPDPLAVAKIDLETQDKTFNPGHVALIQNESYTGVALVLMSEKKPEMDQHLQIQVGNVGPLAGKVVWVNEMEPKLYKIGIQYLE